MVPRGEKGGINDRITNFEKIFDLAKVVIHKSFWNQRGISGRANVSWAKVLDT